ncbi:MAG: SH3 domain-containing protein [Candidatus Marinimicrobia bacterium]|nr:SH3 domain-containing protein [Candidatus Neomarinimicrobiota bacterium]
MSEPPKLSTVSVAVHNPQIPHKYISPVKNRIRKIAGGQNISASDIRTVDYLVLNNGDKIFTGYFYTEDSKYIKTFLIKFDKNDDYSWGKIINRNNIMVPNTLKNLMNNKHLVLGYFTQIEGKKYTPIASDMLIHKFTTQGDSLWLKKIGSTEDSEEALKAEELADSSLLVIGIKTGEKKYLYSIYLSKSGGILWEQEQLVSGKADSINIALQDNGYLISGKIKQYGTDSKQREGNSFVLNIDKSGNKIYYQYPLTGQQLIALKSESADYVARSDNQVAQEKHAFAYITTSEVIVRKEPTINAQILTVLNKNDECQIIDKSDRKYKIGHMEDYWYKLKHGETLGWVYGEFIKFEN